MPELKPRSMRIDDETLKKFQEISKDINGNQQETLSKLIETYEFQAQKALITDRKKDIEDFESYITHLSRMYRQSLEDYQNCTEKVRAAFDGQLQSKDDTILKLQKENSELKAERDQAVAVRGSLEEQTAMLNDRIKNEFEARLGDMQKIINDNESHIELLKNDNQRLKQNAENSDKFRSEYETVKEEIAELKRQLEEQSMKMRKSELELKEQHMNEINKLKGDYLVKIAEYQQKFESVLDKQLEDQKEQIQPKKKTMRKTTAKKAENEAVARNQEEKPS